MPLIKKLSILWTVFFYISITLEVYKHLFLENITKIMHLKIWCLKKGGRGDIM